MRRVVALYRSSVGKKVLMAVSGFIWFGFLLGHMAGNLKAFTGAEHFNEYAHFLREIGTGGHQFGLEMPCLAGQVQ